MNLKRTDKIIDHIDIQCEVDPVAFDDIAMGYRALDRASYGQIF